MFMQTRPFPNSESEPLSLRALVETYERSVILAALLFCRNQREAAQLLGVLPTTFSEKLKRLGLAQGRQGKRAKTFLLGHETYRANRPAPTKDTTTIEEHKK